MALLQGIPTGIMEGEPSPTPRPGQTGPWVPRGPWSPRVPPQRRVPPPMETRVPQKGPIGQGYLQAPDKLTSVLNLDVKPSGALPLLNWTFDQNRPMPQPLPDLPTGWVRPNPREGPQPIPLPRPTPIPTGSSLSGRIPYESRGTVPPPPAPRTRTALGSLY